MTYAYTEANRLEQPHAYMYTPYDGEAFLCTYAEDRIRRARALCDVASPLTSDVDTLARAFGMLGGLFDAVDAHSSAALAELISDLRAGLAHAAVGWPMPAGLDQFSPDQPVITVGLLNTLLEALLTDSNVVATKVWLDRLVQRFEVTKRLYTFYPPGFRKGEGAYTEVRPYWLFALCLALAHARSGQLQYLSTQLKVVDLLLSLPTGALGVDISPNGVALVVAAELSGVQRLARSRRVAFDVG